MLKKRIRILPDATPLERFQSIFIAEWEELLNLKQRVLIESHPDDTHDLRIILRRFRIVVKLFERITTKKVKNNFKSTLKQYSKILGKIRNLDEAIIYFKKRSHLSIRHRICKILLKMRNLESNKIQKKLRQFDHQFEKLVHKMLKQLRQISCTKKMMQSMLSHFTKVSNRYDKTTHDFLITSTVVNNRKSLHAMRAIIRKWRYLLEMIAVILNRNYDFIIIPLKKYQSLLGRINDTAVFQTLCRNISLLPSELKLVEVCLAKEEKRLLKQFIRNINKKPLSKPRFNLSGSTDNSVTSQ